jgi:hypothetical protein
MAREVKNNTEIYTYRDRKFRGTKDFNFSAWIPEQYLDVVLWGYMLVGSIPIWTIFMIFGLLPIPNNFNDPLDMFWFYVKAILWIIPPAYMFRIYNIDRYSDTPTTLRARLLWKHFTRLATIWVEGKPYYGKKKIVQVKVIHPRPKQ